MRASFYALSVIEVISLVNGVAGEVDAEVFENVFVNSRQNHRGVSFRVFEFIELLYGERRVFVCITADGKSYKKLVCVHTGVFVAHVGNLKVMYGLDYFRGDK